MPSVSFSPQELRKFASDVCSDDPEIFAELLEDCQNDIRDQLAQIETARKKEAWRDLSRAAHTLKSAARTFGSPLVKEQSLEVEKLAEGKSGPDDPGRLDAAIQDLQKSSREFEKSLAKIAQSPGQFLAARRS